MIEIRIHGRGGQGAVMAAEMLAKAAFYEGHQVQAFPFFGVERRGAPVESYVRIDNKPIRLRAHIYEPDYLLVFDQRLFDQVDVFDGLKKKGLVFANAVDYKPKNKMITVVVYDMASVVKKFLGRDIVNTAMVYWFAQQTGLIKLENVIKAVKEVFHDRPEILEKNIKLIRELKRELN
ncbi:TPA: pyruvate ferredoxin oxidoreductase [Candidatus Falkowbacteria bacterium]|nr:pyruvate ferredoxin oxidoreductase [Candidatus Falkowbacteria bacterium]